jgi:hypothetical protein
MREANHWLSAFFDTAPSLYHVAANGPLLESLREDPEFERIRTTAQQKLDVMRRRVEQDRW